MEVKGVIVMADSLLSLFGSIPPKVEDQEEWYLIKKQAGEEMIK